MFVCNYSLVDFVIWKENILLMIYFEFNVGFWDDVFKVVVVFYLIGIVIWNVFLFGEKIFD